MCEVNRIIIGLDYTDVVCEVNRIIIGLDYTDAVIKHVETKYLRALQHPAGWYFEVSDKLEHHIYKGGVALYKYSDFETLSE
ncbi:hypothetical protein L195_g051168, partial [Trifolium pratense]